MKSSKQLLVYTMLYCVCHEFNFTSEYCETECAAFEENLNNTQLNSSRISIIEFEESSKMITNPKL